ncbi:hypothetical protein Vretimale_15135 [Volvox reticuliferus]|uniref:VHS domain-containing protein n=1 Tax=Volvox reticuliferus TaxID=1737510 RepID=A0A8J4C506_9CHLO|nr:hypothetical protein Vretifemale_5372 [Volvox reticuliferus]GIM11704.1 hypothetical protein Vretimale_15135 [Volvox reticuliferus]
MAAKIKEGLRDITQGVVERLKGGPKYADNLLGESLQDQLRKATGRELLEPSEELTSQVVDTINQEIADGKDSKEIVGILKKRLRNDNPHKQWLTVLLVGRVMRDCAGALGSHQEELLQEVARVMARPARQDSSAGRTTRQAAKELLRSYGRRGSIAFRAVNRSTLETASASAEYAAAINAAVAREAAIVVQEVKSLIEQAQANTELLSEMLVAEQEHDGQLGPKSSAGPAGDEFENELTRELVTEVRELRGLFDAYLEQLQSMSGEPQVDEMMIKALEAVDMLDGALALQKDVASNQREIEQQATAGGAGTGARPGAGTGLVAATGSNTSADLIMLDDLAEALLPQPPPVVAGTPAVPPPVAVAAAATAAAKPPPLDPFAALDPLAVQATLSPSSTQPQPPGPGPSTATGISGHSMLAGPHGAFLQQQQQHAYMPEPQQTPPYGVYGVLGTSSATYSGVSPPVAAAATNLNNPFATAAMPRLPVPTATGSMVSVSSGNPFEQTAPTGGASNLFAATPAAPSSGGSTSVMDSEWAMFFANRTAGAAASSQQ